MTTVSVQMDLKTVKLNWKEAVGLVLLLGAWLLLAVMTADVWQRMK